MGTPSLFAAMMCDNVYEVLSTRELSEPSGSAFLLGDRSCMLKHSNPRVKTIIGMNYISRIYLTDHTGTSWLEVSSIQNHFHQRDHFKGFAFQLLCLRDSIVST
jgi:hypothetical protein